ncbi:hypothetical protein [Embleya sp. NPDC001921]
MARSSRGRRDNVGCDIHNDDSDSFVYVDSVHGDRKTNDLDGRLNDRAGELTGQATDISTPGRYGFEWNRYLQVHFGTDYSPHARGRMVDVYDVND